MRAVLAVAALLVATLTSCLFDRDGVYACTPDDPCDGGADGGTDGGSGIGGGTGGGSATGGGTGGGSATGGGTGGGGATGGGTGGGSATGGGTGGGSATGGGTGGGGATGGTLLWEAVMAGWNGGDVRVRGVAITPSGEIVVVGSTATGFTSPGTAGDSDGFLRHYAGDGGLLSTEVFGGSAEDHFTHVAIDAWGSVLVAGETLGNIPGATGTSSGRSVFVKTTDPSWTQFFDLGSGFDFAAGLAVDAKDGFRVAVWRATASPSTTYFAEYAKSVGSYSEVATASRSDQAPAAVAVDPDGTSILVGSKMGAALVQRYPKPVGTPSWTASYSRDAGATEARGVAISPDGGIIVVGQDNRAPFLQTWERDGGLRWTVDLGAVGAVVSAVAVDASGNIVVVGGTKPWPQPAGEAFVSKYSAQGSQLWQRQFGGLDSDLATAVAIESAGGIVVAGDTRTDAGVLAGFVQRLTP